jgi:hypothetical protein
MSENIYDNSIVLGFEVFTTVNIKNAVFWDVAPCRFCVNLRFGGEQVASRLSYQLKTPSYIGTEGGRESGSHEKSIESRGVGSVEIRLEGQASR